MPLPKTDDELASAIGSKTCIELRRENSLLLEIFRVLRVAPHATSLAVTDLNMLTSSENRTFIYGEDGMDLQKPARDLWTMRPPMQKLQILDISGKFQPKCFRQMQWLVELLRGSYMLRELKINMFEYPSEEFTAQLWRDHPASLFNPLPAMLGMDRKPTEDEVEGRQFGQDLANSIMGPLITNESNSLMDEVLQSLLAEESTALTTTNNTVGAVLQDLRFKYMSYEEYADVLQILYSTPLPEGLESLSLRIVLRGSQVQSQFLFLPCLKTLDLQFCEMDDDAFDIIGPTIGRRMPNLEKLTLCRNKLQNAQLGFVIGHSLQELDYSYNPITNVGAGHLFQCMEYNSTLNLVNLSYTNITNAVSLKGLNKWMASPARLMIPECYSMDELLNDVVRYIHEGVDVEMVDCAAVDLY